MEDHFSDIQIEGLFYMDPYYTETCRPLPANVPQLFARIDQGNGPKRLPIHDSKGNVLGEVFYATTKEANSLDDGVFHIKTGDKVVLMYESQFFSEDDDEPNTVYKIWEGQLLLRMARSPETRRYTTFS